MACDYLSMVGLKLNHVSKKGTWYSHICDMNKEFFRPPKINRIILHKSNVNIVDLKNNHILLLIDRNVLFWTHYVIVT